MMTRRMITLLGFLTVSSMAQTRGPFVLKEDREWEFLGAAQFRGTYVNMESNRVSIAMQDGVVRQFWPGWAEGVSVSHLQRSMCRLPNAPKAPTPAPGPGPVISLTAANLPAGPLTHWPNQGRLGGSFTAMNLPPTVRELNGRKAVVFEHTPWLCPMEFQAMVSDFYMPQPMIGGESMTVVAWLCNTGGIVDRETFLCWGAKDCGELDTPDFSYGCYQGMQWYRDTLNIPADRFPKLNQWHQLAFVVSMPQRDAEIRIYADGRFLTSRKFRKPEPKWLADNLAFLGCAWEAWWGHAWATRPARPYTGGIGRLEVYDRALSEADIQKLNGADTTLASLPAPSGINSATAPAPSNGAGNVDTGLVRLQWKPHPDALIQNLYFGTNREAVVNGTSACIKNFKAGIAQSYLAVDLAVNRLDIDRAYYWRVEQVPENKAAAVPGDLWTFTTGPFDLEDDGPVSQPFPPEVRQDGFYSRYMECEGDPIISPPGIFDVEMRSARHAIQKFTAKRPDVVKALQAANAACHLATREHPDWGWSQFSCACYGGAAAALREDAIIMHEMGHQYHMSGGEMLEPDFRYRLGEAFDANRRERKWIGDYGGKNMWENVACCATAWINNLTQDEGGDSPREVLRLGDPRISAFLADYWPGDTIVELHPAQRLKTDATGRLLEWGNNSGVEYFKPGAGWRYYERSVGRFTPAGAPALRTVGGVSAVTFSGSDSLAWDKNLWEALDGNRPWSIELWVRRDAPPARNENLISWGPPGASASLLTWGAGDEAYTLSGGQRGRWTRKPGNGAWHHLVYVYTGGGLDERAGQLRVYVDGQLDSTTAFKLALPPNCPLTVGQGFTGALAHLRVYNYALHPLQIERIRSEEASWYARENLAVAGELLVDLDARALAPCPQGETQPFYPEPLKQPWLRSWANRGTLGGKIHNERSSPSRSAPQVSTAQGVTAISFTGDDRMISSFTGSPCGAGTVEAWVSTAMGSADESILQWGPVELPASLAPAGGWHHITLTFDSAKVTAFVDGERIRQSMKFAAPGPGDRLSLGAAWDRHGWHRFLHGALAQVRVHRGALTPEQVARNFRDSALQLASMPGPALDSEVAAARRPALTWQGGVTSTAGMYDVYLGTNAEKIASATRSSPDYQGVRTPGTLVPSLRPGTPYFWRVDELDRRSTPLRTGTVWNFRTAGGRLIDLNASGLPAGAVTQWANLGASGGRFTLDSEQACWAPEVVTLDGRKGLDFAGRKFLVSSAPAPDALMGSAPFTVSIHGYCRDVRGLPHEQTMLSWGRRPLERAEFCWGWSTNWGAFVYGERKQFPFGGPVNTNVFGWHHNAPMPAGWRHIAYTYSGGPNPSLKIYVDGKLNRQESVTLNVKTGTPICIGGAIAGKEPDWPFGGVFADIAIAGRVLSDADVARLASATPTSAGGNDWLVRLDASTLQEGSRISSWTNRGTLGGAFVLAQYPPITPKAAVVAGRPAVTFESPGSFLTSDINTPAALTGDHAFTSEMWVLNPNFDERETVFSLAPEVALKSFPYDATTRAANFNFGRGNESGNREVRPGVFMTGHSTHHVGWKEKAPDTGKWHHIACVYTGGYKGEMRVYVDGQLDNRRAYYSLYTMAGYPMRIGASWNTATGRQSPFTGSLASFQLYDYARTDEEIRRDASPERTDAQHND